MVSSCNILSQSRQTRTSPVLSQVLPISPITEIDPFEGEESDQADGVVDEKIWPIYEDESEGDIDLERDSSG